MPDDTTQNEVPQEVETEEEMSIEDVLEALVAEVTALSARIETLEGHMNESPSREEAIRGEIGAISKANDEKFSKFTGDIQKSIYGPQ